MHDGVTDVLALYALQIDYAHVIDSFDAEALADLFTADGILDASGIGLSQIVGRDAIVASMAGRFANIAHTFHLTANQRITRILGDDAQGFCYFMAKTHLRDGGRSEFTGRYDDSYRREATGWKIARRALVALLPTVVARPSDLG